MTSHEKLIAETAIAQPKAQTYEVIHGEVSKITGIGKTDVGNTLNRLSRELFVHRRAIPAVNRAEAPDTSREITWAWYEKGDYWPKK